MSNEFENLILLFFFLLLALKQTIIVIARKRFWLNEVPITLLFIVFYFSVVVPLPFQFATAAGRRDVEDGGKGVFRSNTLSYYYLYMTRTDDVQFIQFAYRIYIYRLDGVVRAREITCIFYSTMLACFGVYIAADETSTGPCPEKRVLLNFWTAIHSRPVCRRSTVVFVANAGSRKKKKPESDIECTRWCWLCSALLKHVLDAGNVMKCYIT